MYRVIKIFDYTTYIRNMKTNEAHFSSAKSVNVKITLHYKMSQSSQ